MPVGQINNSQMKDILDGEFQRSSDPSFLSRIAVSKYMNIPGLRGFWGPGVRNDTAYGGVPYITDLSGNGYHMPTVHGPRLSAGPEMSSYWWFDGANDYCTLADNSQFDILGNEAWLESPGISLGAWVQTGRARPYAGDEGIIAKWAAVNQLSYILLLDQLNPNQNGLTLGLSANGAAWYAFDHSKPVLQNTWYFVAATYNPSAYYGEPAGVRLWVNDIVQYHAISDRNSGLGNILPASIFNSNSPVEFASIGAADLWSGVQTYWWISGQYLLQGEIFNLYETTKTLFGYVNERGSSW